ncbi:MAG: TIGR01777 family protein [Chloroflexi bacterium]|nr:TIGR01777 family protein [Chloroflexota bacterium]
MIILITGSSGFVGSALVHSLTGEGHSVVRLVRRPVVGDDEVQWDPARGSLDPEALAGVEAVVHLAGESLAEGRWTATKKARIRDSRLNGTRLLSEAIAGMSSPPNVLVSASAKDYYGDRGAELLPENSPAGSDFLAEVIHQWETACGPAAEAGIRVVNMRSGLVLDRGGGALAKMLLPFRLGIGGRLGNGRQYMPWVSLEDMVRVIAHCVKTEAVEGPVNVAAPQVVTNAEFTRALGRAVSRPTLFPVPAFALRVLFGEVAHALLASALLDPSKLMGTGFKFNHPTLDEGLEAALRGR